MNCCRQIIDETCHIRLNRVRLLQAHPNRLHYHLLLDLPKRYGTICKIFLGARPYVIVSDPALVEQIGTRQFMSFHDR